MIIGLNGDIGSGKDTVGGIIQNLTKKPIEGFVTVSDGKMEPAMGGSDWKIVKFAGKLKKIASILTGIPVEKFEDQEFKKTRLGVQWDGMTVREFLQKLGTEAVRDGLHSNGWVNATFADYVPDWNLTRASAGELPKWIITDTRFANEAKAIKDRGGIVVRIERFGDAKCGACGHTEKEHFILKDGKKYSTYRHIWVDEFEKHPSETGLSTWSFDHVIDNNGTMDDLIQEVKLLLEKFHVQD